MSQLRLAIDATGILDPHPSGISRYTRCLIEALSSLPAQPTEFDVVQLWRSSRWRTRAQLPQGPRLSRQLWRDNLWPLRRPYDVVHCPAHRMPQWTGPAYVSTVHDLYAALGINHETARERERQMAVYRELRDRSQRIVCVSAHTRADFLRLIGGDAERVHVVHLGVSPRFQPQATDVLAAMRTRYALAAPYLLMVGYATANKNLDRLLQAYAASATHKDYELVLAGNAGAEARERLAARVSSLALGKRVRVLGYVDDADLPALYAGASAYLFPSLYEGFGLPILEAMASGVPVLTSTAASCPEVAAGHAVLAEPESVDAIAAGLDRVVEMPQAQRDAARAYAATKTWQRTAEQTLSIYRLAAGDRA